MNSNFDQIISLIIEHNPKDRAAFERLKNKFCSQLGISQPTNKELMQSYQKLLKMKRVKKSEAVEMFLRKAGVRSTSGIAVITSLLKPYTCPGKCIYCPTETRMPKSYIASEPAAARSLRLDFDPYLLMQKRIEMLESNGHPTDKIEYITKGGTWNAYPLKYQYWYILESFKACNNFSRRKPTPPTKESHWNNKQIEELQQAVEIEQRYNESAKHRIIGITLETRPDAISPRTIYHMRRQGCTRVELGLQAPDDQILDLVKRGHTVQQFKDAIWLLREAGFKVDLHFMPDLPGTTPEHDVEMYKFLFEDPGLRPDMVKIYPNTVIKSAELYQWFLDGRYKSYGDEALFHALLEMKLATPRYCRISRLIRDIPATEIEDGNIVTNLREVLEHELKKQGKKCVCLRCREITRQEKYLPQETEPELFVDTYETDGGIEYFITLEDPNRIAVYGFLRLRLPNLSLIKDPKQVEQRKQLFKLMPEIKHCAFIRELHVYGQLVKIGDKDSTATQHKGYGKKLMTEAEKIAQKNGFSKVAVISGVGVRGYYRKLGYRKVGSYMVKKSSTTYLNTHNHNTPADTSLVLS